MIRLAVRVGRAECELVLAELLALAPSGVEEVEHEDGSVEYAVYGAPGELPALPDLRAAAGAALVEVSSRSVPDDWAERWKLFHRPVTVTGTDGGPALVVRPPWAPPRTGPLREVVIDPGQAFGTGAHPSTRLCLELLVALGERDAPGGALCDVGCGSGVLAIAAHRLGFRPVLAVDHDPAALQATRANAAANEVTLSVKRCDLRRDPLPAAPTITANLLRPLLLELAGRLPAAVRTVIAGGLLRSEADEISRAISRRRGLSERARREEGDWAAVMLG